jgi:uncharacterized integral membrane protein
VLAAVISATLRIESLFVYLAKVRVVLKVAKVVSSCGCVLSSLVRVS